MSKLEKGQNITKCAEEKAVELDWEMSMDAKLIGKFITQQVVAAMDEKTKQYEKKMKIWRKVETTECRESPQKTVRGAVDAPSRKKKTHNSDDYKVKNTTEIYVSIGTRTKKHSLDPLEGKNPKSRLF